MNRLRRLIRERARILPPLDAYRLWAANYPPEAHNAFMRLEEATMRDLLPPLHGRTVLDLGCGSGRYGRLARELGAGAVVGIDNSADMLRRAVIPAALASMDALPFPANRFDVILCGLAVGHLPGPAFERSLHEIGRVLKVDGTALISDFHPYAALSGAQRTFTGSDGRAYAVEHHIHLIAEYARIGRAAGLTLDAIEERGAKMGDAPAILVVRMSKRLC